MRKMLQPVLALVPATGAPPSLALEAGEKAPDFEAESTAGTVRLKDYLGSRNVLLAFYFKDFTGG